MANAKPRKRPCSICRKWFLPDVRQKGRQTTWSLECRNKKHRRQCEGWNQNGSIPYLLFLPSAICPCSWALPTPAVRMNPHLQSRALCPGPFALGPWLLIIWDTDLTKEHGLIIRSSWLLPLAFQLIYKAVYRM